MSSILFEKRGALVSYTTHEDVKIEVGPIISSIVLICSLIQSRIYVLSKLTIGYAFLWQFATRDMIALELNVSKKCRKHCAELSRNEQVMAAEAPY